mgnify:CR=1 FL=1
MKLLHVFIVTLIVFFTVSCKTQQKMPQYLQDLNDTIDKQVAKATELTIQKNDVLSIRIFSQSTKPEVTDAVYNLSVNSDAPPNGGGYLVDAAGNIELPQVGTIRAEGLTKIQLSDLIKKKINEKDSVLVNPAVLVRFQNLKVTVLGEVKKPGLINFPGEKLNILEAIGLAGDIDLYGLKNNIKVIRDHNGEREIGTIDLSSKDVFNSPYYNLIQNDILLVEASKVKAKKQDQDVFLRQAGFILSIITAMAVVFRLFQ